MDRDSSLFYLCLADNEFLLGNINESLVFLNRAYSNNSKNTDILRDLFICYTLIDEPEKSLKYCKKYLERIEESKHNFISYNRIGYAYWNNGYKKEGYIYFRKQIKNSEELIKKGQSYATSYRLAPYYDLAVSGNYKCEISVNRNASVSASLITDFQRKKIKEHYFQR